MARLGPVMRLCHRRGGRAVPASTRRAVQVARGRPGGPDWLTVLQPPAYAPDVNPGISNSVGRAGGVCAGGQDLVELAAGADAELGEDLVQVVLGGERADEHPGADLGVGQAVPASRATWASWAVSGSLA